MNHDDCDVQTLALELVGSFARVQEAIKQVAEIYFNKKTPELSKFVRRRALKNMKDEDRLELTKGLARDLEVDIQMPTFAATFNSLKKTRDAIAHSARFCVEDGGRWSPNEANGWMQMATATLSGLQGASSRTGSSTAGGYGTVFSPSWPIQASSRR